MSCPPPRNEAAPIGWMILGLLAIPVLSVTAAASISDMASATDPAAAAVGIPALLGGAVMGALVFRLARIVRSGAVAVCAAVLARLDDSLGAIDMAATSLGPMPVSRPISVFVPAAVGRRGPPLSSR